MYTRQILNALCSGPSFLVDVPEADVFDRSGLEVPDSGSPLDLDQKLGYIYEDGLRKLLDATERYEVLEHGLQIQRDRHQTIGELDFLFRDTSSPDLIHLELAVKFYLAIDSAEGLLLPGPNSRDNYYNKLERLRSHQLTLAKRFPELLPPQYQKEVIHTQHLVIGCLFDHIDTHSLAEPPYIHPNARRGIWLCQSEFQAYFPHCTTPLVIPKPLWAVDVSVIADSQLTPFDLEAPLTRCTMLKVANEDKAVFITPDNYPEQ